MAAELEKTTELQRLGKPRIKLNIDENRTVRIGERHRWSTLRRKLEAGIAPSRLKAHIIRESYVTGKGYPACDNNPRT
jgi:hypothetical protein